MRISINTKLLLLLSLSGLMPVLVNGQQNLQFSQYVFNMLSVNPAYAGYKEDLYLNATYRHQWVSFPGAPQTGSVSLDGVINSRDERVGLGVQAMFDKLGPQDAASFYGMYSYRIPLDEEGTRRLCLGIGAGVSQYSVDGTALQYNDAGDPSVPAAKVSSFVPDARFGIYYYTPNFYASVSVMDLFSLYTDNTKYYWSGYTYKVIRKTQHLYLTAGTLINLSEKLKLKPSFLIKEDFKGPTNLDLNAFLLISDRVWLGGSYRTGVRLWSKSHLDNDLEQLDAWSAIVEIYATERLRIGYAYDVTISKMASSQSGSHEISLGFTFPNKKRRIISPRYF
ncbi:PorP/SprF family type IX secretion system membrane protein [Chitinophaga nivalis]|uniref:Type IX secretion system membrane protein PorP/SprF n=1 Tax=Chitinophaga nivalis TaxID=2991709 RepID=A0ABT3IN09_9BACT|nr:type IX secretion system membrane protein PorP/SprF [Chitinophaga nivalis]MCW3464946.1 type IX secretion system membrane protein PorP/SprF [Chitinophaga nivalis]MCW3485362.1 type IX secretion system membrane protein PorP/SprF [Chitinophaga nivalis]